MDELIQSEGSGRPLGSSALLTGADVTELDCETFDSTVRSLCSMTGIGSDVVHARVSAWSWRAFERFAQRRGIGGFEVARIELWRRVFGDIPSPVPGAVYWFHATRVLPNTDFAEGLLPLPSAMSRLIEALERIGLRPAPTTSGSFHRAAHDEKMQRRASWGPFGHLVRDAAFSSIQNHYFRAPEAVVDLGFDLDAFRDATVPCIVKFRATNPRDDVAELALYYAYLAAWGKPADWDCSTTWGGDGHTVPHEDIVKVEFLDLDDSLFD